MKVDVDMHDNQLPDGKTHREETDATLRAVFVFGPVLGAFTWGAVVATLAKWLGAW